MNIRLLFAPTIEVGAEVLLVRKDTAGEIIEAYQIDLESVGDALLVEMLSYNDFDPKKLPSIENFLLEHGYDDKEVFELFGVPADEVDQWSFLLAEDYTEDEADPDPAAGKGEGGGDDD